MNRSLLLNGVCLLLAISVAACDRRVTEAASRVGDIGPHLTVIEPDFDTNHFKVDHPEQFALTTAGEYVAAPEMNVTGVVSPDVSRQVPVPSLTSGRVIEVNARLGDHVQKGQLLFKVRSTDIAAAYSDYRKAVRNEELARIQLDRAKTLYEHGAIPKSTLETAQTAEDNAVVDVETATEHLRLLGSDPNHPSGIVEVYASVSGIITDQQITTSSGVQALTQPNPFTISDISHVWIICDVYENNLAQVHLGDSADIHLAAYPNKVLKGLVSNILPVIDPNIRTAKVRLEVENPGILRLGMFVTATFRGTTAEKHATVPAAAILHLHDREWVYMPAENNGFRRVEIFAGNMVPGNLQEVISGVKPGDRVVASALMFQQTAEQK
jgi:cobalt-zinc-cadmium efflux system membrane fusion protein